MDRDLWELLLIDNITSTPLSINWDLSWHPNGRHVREDVLGLTPARLRGISEAVGDLLVFVDDDNILSRSYLDRVAEIAHGNPVVGVIGAGSIEPEFEVIPEAFLEPYLNMLALRSTKRPAWSSERGDFIVPWGAGMAVRKVVASRYSAEVSACPIRYGLDRKGLNLNSGGDDEFSWIACEMGLGKGIFPELRLTHLIPKERVVPEYLLRIAEGHAYSGAMLRYAHGEAFQCVQADPSFTEVLRGLLRASPSIFFCEGLRWWEHRRRHKFGRAIERARLQGIRRAIDAANQITMEVRT